MGRPHSLSQPTIQVSYMALARRSLWYTLPYKACISRAYRKQRWTLYMAGRTQDAMRQSPDVHQPVSIQHITWRVSTVFFWLHLLWWYCPSLVDSPGTSTHIPQGCFKSTGSVMRCLLCQWSNPEDYGGTTSNDDSTKQSAKHVTLS